MRGDIVLLNIYCSAAMMEVCCGQKNLRFNGFSGRKLFLSTQGPDPRLFFCAAFTSYYEESDRGQTITTQKKTTYSSNSHQKTQEYIQGKSPLFIL